MSELSNINAKLDDLKQIVTHHIAQTDEYRKNRDKILDAHSEALWDKDGRPGALTQLDRLMQKEHNRTWITRAVAGAVAALGIERIWHLLKP